MLAALCHRWEDKGLPGRPEVRAITESRDARLTIRVHTGTGWQTLPRALDGGTCMRRCVRGAVAVLMCTQPAHGCDPLPACPPAYLPRIYTCPPP